MAGIERPEGADLVDAPAPERAPRGFFSRRRVLLIVGTIGVAFVVARTSRFLESTVQSSLRVGPLLFRMTQSIGGLVPDAIGGLWDAGVRFVNRVPLPGTDALIETMHTFADGTRVVLTHTGAELVDIGMAGGRAFLDALPTAEAVGRTVELTLETGLGTITRVVELTPELTAALHAAAREVVAQQAHRMMVTGAERVVLGVGNLAVGVAQDAGQAGLHFAYERALRLLPQQPQIPQAPQAPANDAQPQPRVD